MTANDEFEYIGQIDKLCQEFAEGAAALAALFRRPHSLTKAEDILAQSKGLLRPGSFRDSLVGDDLDKTLELAEAVHRELTNMRQILSGMLGAWLAHGKDNLIPKLSYKVDELRKLSRGDSDVTGEKK